MINKTEMNTHSEGWLKGYMSCAKFAESIATNDDQRALADRLLLDALEGQAEADADAAVEAT